jgi:hypothetical protein
MDLVLTGPGRLLQAYGALGLEVFVADDLEPRIFREWDVSMLLSQLFILRSSHEPSMEPLATS